MKLHRFLPPFLFAFAVFSAHGKDIASSPDAIKLSHQIKAEGAATAVARLHQPDLSHGWDWVIKQVMTGNQSWLNTAAALRTETDAGDSESLDVALAYALPKNPAGVLTLLGSTFKVEKVCSAPFIEPEPAFLKTYISQTRLALQRQKSKKLISSRDACLAQLDALHSVSSAIF